MLEAAQKAGVNVVALTAAVTDVSSDQVAAAANYLAAVPGQLEALRQSLDAGVAVLQDNLNKVLTAGCVLLAVLLVCTAYVLPPCCCCCCDTAAAVLPPRRAPTPLALLAAPSSALAPTAHPQTLQDVSDSYEEPTLAIQEQWRFIPIAVLFGTTALLAALAAPLFWRLRWYRCATLLSVVLWLDVALLMFLGVGEPRFIPMQSRLLGCCACGMHGLSPRLPAHDPPPPRAPPRPRLASLPPLSAGLLNGVYVVSTDTCLYAEFLAISLALREVPEAQRQYVSRVLGQRAAPSHTRWALLCCCCCALGRTACCPPTLRPAPHCFLPPNRSSPPSSTTLAW